MYILRVKVQKCNHSNAILFVMGLACTLISYWRVLMLFYLSWARRVFLALQYVTIATFFSEHHDRMCVQ